MRNFFILVLCLGLIGCATVRGYETILNSWIGHDINDLVNKWGYPDSFIAPDGNKVYVFSNSRSFRRPMYTSMGYDAFGNATATTTGGGTATSWCKTYFEVDQNNKIIKWRWEGNSCRAGGII